MNTKSERTENARVGSSLGQIFILGDSYSTFKNYIPVGYDYYYPQKGQEGIAVNQLEHTWWFQFMNATSAKLVLNSSCSGTTICNIGYGGIDCSDRSFIGRFDKLVQDNYFVENKVDTCIVFGGTNDSWADSPVGELQYSDWTKKDLDASLPAFCYLLSQIKKHLPDARIIVIINYGLKGCLVEGYNCAAKHYGVEVIELQDFEKRDGHPTLEGMKQINEQLCSWLRNFETGGDIY